MEPKYPNIVKEVRLTLPIDVYVNLEHVAITQGAKPDCNGNVSKAVGTLIREAIVKTYELS